MAVAALAAGLAIASPAQAAVVARVGSTAGYLAFPGEANDVRVVSQAGTTVFEDRGSGVFVVGPGCVALGARDAACDGALSLRVALGDGDDRLVALTGLPLRAYGGPGDDVLAGGTGPDVLDGGPGWDAADYSGRTRGVVVTLDGQANDGEPGEGDDVEEVERVAGGQGDDVLVGDGWANTLLGEGGNDALAGGGGEDVLDGGTGNDGINAEDPVAAPDLVGCGTQRDRVYGDAEDVVAADCESVDRSGTLGYATIATAGPDPPVLGRSVVVRPLRGAVLVVPARPGSRRRGPAGPPIPLDGERNIPVGSVLDTRFGRVGLTVAVDPRGGTRFGAFDSGAFRVLQRRRPGATADLMLRGGKAFRRCGGRGLRVLSARRRPWPAIRRLWGDAHGSFRTAGRYAAATVRGTRWLTADLCSGTLVRVVRGAVVVRDAVRGRDVVVTAGKQYLARRLR